MKIIGGYPSTAQPWCSHHLYRLGCIVPFCGRTRTHRKNDPITPGAQWICADHWRLVDRTLRKLHGRAYRDVRDGRSPPARSWRLWCRAKRQAIERAAGI